MPDGHRHSESSPPIQMKNYDKWRMNMKPWCMVKTFIKKCGDQMTDDDAITFIWFMVCMSENCGKCVITSNVCHLY